VALPLRDKVRADGIDRRGSAIDLAAVQAAFGAVHLHSQRTEAVAATFKATAPLSSSTSAASHLSDILQA